MVDEEGVHGVEGEVDPVVVLDVAMVVFGERAGGVF